jgi:cation transport regulator
MNCSYYGLNGDLLPRVTPPGALTPKPFNLDHHSKKVINAQTSTGGVLMAYESVSELPKSVRNLPSRAKALYMKAYNSCWDDLENTDEAAREKASHESAWSAVKEQYEKDDETGEWVKSEDITGKRSRHRKSRSSGASLQAKAHA